MNATTAVPAPRARLYHGWIVLLVAAAAMVGTLPARTQGLGLVTEPILRELGIGRVAWAQLNLWATLVGATFALGIGRLLDGLGSRVVLTAVALGLGGVVVLMARADSFASLALWVTLSRGLGQSALSVVSIAMVGQWFVRRIDGAMALYSIVLTVGFMVAFPVVGGLVESRGWRPAWTGVGLALVLALAPLAWLLVRRGPEAVGLAPDGDGSADAGRAAKGAEAAEPAGHTLGAALATPAFWVFAVGAALYGLVAAGIGLFNESILAERGFDAGVYHQTLAVTALTGLAGNFLGGWLAARVALGRLMAAALFVLAAGLVALPHVTSLAQVMLWATGMGLGGGLVMVLFFAVWPRLYGRRQLGRVQGVAQAITVVASAVGPLLLAACVEATGSYAAAFRLLGSAIAAAAGLALLVRLPRASGAARGTHAAAG